MGNYNGENEYEPCRICNYDYYYYHCYVKILKPLCCVNVNFPFGTIEDYRMILYRIGPVNGSRYMARLRATGADWGLDTRICCGFDKHLYLTSYVNARNHNITTARKMALFIIS